MLKSDSLGISDVRASPNPLSADLHNEPGRGPSVPVRLKRAIFEFFNSGAGSKVSAALIDVHFRLWRLRHPGAQFSDYYAGSIAQQLKRGGTHKTLGRKKFLSGSLGASPASWNLHENRKRGTKFLQLAIEHGLRPEHTCIDYGCGSLRVGQHFIIHQDAGNYLGLDMVSDFYEAGTTLLPQGLIAAKKPRFHVIAEQSLDAARQMEPSFIFSFSVLKHVPPAELDAYFRNICGMMAPHSQAVITFNEAEHSSRTGAKIWDYARDEITASVLSQGAGLECTIGPLKTGPGTASLPRTSVLVIRGEGAEPSSA